MKNYSRLFRTTGILALTALLTMGRGAVAETSNNSACDDPALTKKEVFQCVCDKYGGVYVETADEYVCFFPSTGNESFCSKDFKKCDIRRKKNILPNDGFGLLPESPSFDATQVAPLDPSQVVLEIAPDGQTLAAAVAPESESADTGLAELFAAMESRADEADSFFDLEEPEIDDEIEPEVSREEDEFMIDDSIEDVVTNGAAVEARDQETDGAPVDKGPMCGAGAGASMATAMTPPWLLSKRRRRRRGDCQSRRI